MSYARSVATNNHVIIVVLFAALSFSANIASAQSIVASTGVAFVQGVNNDQAVSTLGLALEMPLSARWSGRFEYLYWTGENHTLKDLGESGAFLLGQNEFNANQGFTAVACYDVLLLGPAALAVEAGLSAYRVSVAASPPGSVPVLTDKRFDAAIDMGGFLNVQASRNVDLRAEVRFGFDGWADLRSRYADWVFVRLGVGYRL